jgi:hypothetical protein
MIPRTLFSPDKMFASLRTTSRFIISSWTPQAYDDIPQEKDNMEEEQSQSLISETTETAQDKNSSKTSSSPRRHKWTIGLASGIIITIFIILIPILTHQPHHPKIWTSCGSNPSTARSRGCQFDLISFSWQTPECYDSTLVSEFASFSPWTFWTSENGTETVSLEEAFLGERKLWFPWRYHVVHCTFVWRKMHRAYEVGWIDSDLRGYGHTMHCQKMVLMEMEGEESEEGRFFEVDGERVVTAANVIYPTCERLGVGTTKSRWWESVPPR